MKKLFVGVLGFLYRTVGTGVFFLFDSEPIHEFFLHLGGVLGAIPGVPHLMRACIRVADPSLKTSVAGISFDNPVGMAAGFDHEAQLTQIISALGFGFESVGTVTNKPYGGNSYPRIKRLVKSKSILVNKGFKSTGMDAVLKKLAGKTFDIPIGLSIGRTNTDEHNDHADAIADIIESFRKAAASDVPFSYFELNISCPNLTKDISFYEPGPLEQLLRAVFSLGFSKPLFIKMPITLSNEKTLALVDVIHKFPVAVVTFGNLQHDRKNPAFDKKEMEEFGRYRGNWSGMPCQSRSDELIKLVYQHTKGTLPIVGCGGIFTPEDAYRKIKLGASLVQLVTGLIFKGPQLPAEICLALPTLLQKDGFKNVAEAVGVDA